MKIKWPKKIYTLDNSEPHESLGGWKKFLQSCEVRDRYRGVIFFGSVNCNYILFADGLLIKNFGYHGKAFMNRIKENGIVKIKKEQKEFYKEIRRVLDKLNA